jgi:hypothetical protein
VSGTNSDGRLAEIFPNAAKGRTAINAAARDSAVVASIALQHGVDLPASPPEFWGGEQKSDEFFK